MAIIVDKRKSKDSIETVKKKFFDRNRRAIRGQIDKIIQRTKIKDLTKKSQEVIIPRGSLHEPRFRYDPHSSKHRFVSTGNKQYKKGFQWEIPKRGMGGGSGEGSGGDGTGNDDFIFTLTKEEFIRFLFDNLELPYFVKKRGSLSKYVIKRSGYTKKSIPSKLDLKKTFQQAIARKIASKTKGPFLDDIDLRYKLFKKKSIPWTKAVMFCVMDVSGSMDQHRKLIAKKFYILLYLFLSQKYPQVDIVFIRHHTSAVECSEHDFFYAKETGGTMVSSGLDLANTIIKDRYSPEDWNIYIAQAGDCENFTQDNERCKSLITEQLLPKVQYFVSYCVAETVWDSSFKNTLIDLDNKHNNFSFSIKNKSVYEDFRKFFERTGMAECK